MTALWISIATGALSVIVAQAICTVRRAGASALYVQGWDAYRSRKPMSSTDPAPFRRGWMDARDAYEANRQWTL